MMAASAERIGQRSSGSGTGSSMAQPRCSVPPEQARHLGHRAGSVRERLLVDGIPIGDMQAQEARGIRPRLFGVKGHDKSIADFELGMADHSALDIDAA